MKKEVVSWFVGLGLAGLGWLGVIVSIVYGVILHFHALHECAQVHDSLSTLFWGLPPIVAQLHLCALLNWNTQHRFVVLCMVTLIIFVISLILLLIGSLLTKDD